MNVECGMRNEELSGVQSEDCGLRSIPASDCARVHSTATGCCRLLPIITFAALLIALPRTTSAQANANAKVTQSSPVKARIWCIPEKCEDPATAKRQFADVTLVGRTSTHLVLAPDANAVLPTRIPLSTVVAADFEFDYDKFEVTRAMAKNDWAKAIRILSAAYSPTYIYLDIPDNNAIEGAMDLGTTMMKSAKRTLRNAKTNAEHDTACQQFEAAYKVFTACSKATWSDLGNIGMLKGCRCQLAIDSDRASQAERRISAMDEPTPGDDAYGHYWLLKAEIAMLRKDVTNAVDAAVKSLCFENKDIETFPDALMISAECYEKLDNPYRARDVYFEVAKLFPDTDWAADALVRLEAILKSGKTAKKETATVESTFFGLEEDMNALAEALIKERRNARNVTADDNEKE